MPKPVTAVVCADVSPEQPSDGREPDVSQTSAPRWTRICRTDEIPRLGARVVRRGVAPNIALFRTASDAFFALVDRCPHRGGPLSQGIVYGERVACPLHNTNVELDSGCAVAPDNGRVPRFRVKVEADFVYIDLAPQADENH